jgi:hypothetical protein
MPLCNTEEVAANSCMGVGVSVCEEDQNGCMPAHCAAAAGHIIVLQWIQQKDEGLLFKPNGRYTHALRIAPMLP